jgi:hypothetical protein
MKRMVGSMLQVRETGNLKRPVFLPLALHQVLEFETIQVSYISNRHS